MAETLTPNFGWTKPDPGASANTWGSTLNATTDKIDAQVFTNQQAGVPVGSGALWFTPTPPTNWLICDGSSLSTTAYPALFAAIGYTFGGSGANFNLPALAGKFPFAAGAGIALAATGGANSVALTTDMLPSHAHPITDVAHSHGASQAAHSHSVYQDPHSHNVSQDAHSHGLTAQVLTPSGGGNAGAAAGWAFTSPRTDTQQPAVHIDTQQPGVHADTQQPGVSIAASGTGLSTTQAVGSSSPVPTVPPFLGVNFIIKFA